MKYHVAKHKYAPAGPKQLKVAQALFDNDRPTGATGGSYLARSGRFVREARADVSGPTQTSVSRREKARQLALVLDVDGPRYVLQRKIGAALHALQYGYSFYTQAFATAFFHSALLGQARFERVMNEMAARSQANGSEVTPLLPRRKEKWVELVEDVFSSAPVSELPHKLVAECEEHGELKLVTIAGDFKPCLPLLGQARHGSTAAEHADQAMPQADVKHTVLTIRGISGAVLGVRAARSESADDVVRALGKNLTMAQLEKVAHACVDSPSHELLKFLQGVCANLLGLRLKHGPPPPRLCSRVSQGRVEATRESVLPPDREETGCYRGTKGGRDILQRDGLQGS